MIFKLRTKKSLDEVARALEQAAARHQFGIMAIHSLRDKMREKGVSFEQDCLVFEVCNPHQAKKVLEANLEISTALPCRIAVYTRDGEVELATLRPTELLALFGNESLNPVAEEVEATMLAMMQEAAS